LEGDPLRKKQKIYRKRKRGRRLRRIFVSLLIIILSILCFLLYKQNKLLKAKEVQALTSGKKSEVTKSTEAGNTNSINKEAENTDLMANKSDIKQDSNSYDAAKIQDYLSKNIKINDGKKIAFLTFDDGPSTTVTPTILNILRQNNVKATFFVVGKQVEENENTKKILQNIYNQGHAIANHTYSHNYTKLYPSGIVNVQAFMEEIDKTNEILKNVLGEDFQSRVIRFPGGHASWKGVEKLDEELVKEGYKYIDWNALIGDAEGITSTKEQYIKRYNETFKGQEKVVILMHDTYGKKSTADVLQYIITDLKNKGYEFKTLK
jgi:Predicted xylanase/chitin deacetylase